MRLWRCAGGALDGRAMKAVYLLLFSLVAVAVAMFVAVN